MFRNASKKPCQIITLSLSYFSLDLPASILWLRSLKGVRNAAKRSCQIISLSFFSLDPQIIVRKGDRRPGRLYLYRLCVQSVLREFKKVAPYCHYLYALLLSGLKIISRKGAWLPALFTGAKPNTAQECKTPQHSAEMPIKSTLAKYSNMNKPALTNP